ncbi:solute carrier family 9 (sodium/hydrogen exchanger), member 3 [Paragonimus westermani]|uniref:Sodium/hydrogen exchanger n=1 Tax=Paragonimus westermani TaxID=34504 RepID=A0A5J4NCX1_9TREM|nr:solute carrier family 9 (sodium/hydrogen exchanger), member 3 [Paragonimus westermani]
MGVIAWRFTEFSSHITVLVFLLSLILIKMFYSHCGYLQTYVPDSVMLMLIGVLFAVIIRYGINFGPLENTIWMLTPNRFYNYLLPPVVLESAYQLYHRTFRDHIGVTVIFAVAVTVISFLLIGPLMYCMHKFGWFGLPDLHMNLKHFLLFGSLIVAVDSITVMAIFQDVQVDIVLYYLVMGESLFNDAATLVLYQIMSNLIGTQHVLLRQIGLGVASFFTISVGGFLIGTVVGMLSCWITQMKTKLGALVLILAAYLAYIVASMVGWSGVISMITCGMIQAAYGFHNLDLASVATVRVTTGISAELCQALIMLHMGVAMVSEPLEWHTGFHLCALICCVFARTVTVLFVSRLINLFRTKCDRITYTSQLILIYGGLRGAVAFCLAILVSADQLGPQGIYIRQLMLTSTLFIIFVTVFLMGLTMKPLVNRLKVHTEKSVRVSLFLEVQNLVLDELNAGVCAIVGDFGQSVLSKFIIRISERWIRPCLQRNSGTRGQAIVNKHHELLWMIHHAATVIPTKPFSQNVRANVTDLLKPRQAFYLNNVVRNSYDYLSSTHCDNEDRQVEDADSDKDVLLSDLEPLMMSPDHRSFLSNGTRGKAFLESFMNRIKSRISCLKIMRVNPSAPSHSVPDASEVEKILQEECQ